MQVELTASARPTGGFDALPPRGRNFVAQDGRRGNPGSRTTTNRGMSDNMMNLVESGERAQNAASSGEWGLIPWPDPAWLRRYRRLAKDFDWGRYV